MAVSAVAATVRSRFRGALVGALVGDCLGAYWELQSWKGSHPIQRVKARIEEQIQETTSGKAPVISYTDDTALTFAMAESLVQCRGFDAEHMARRLTKEFFDDPRRGYGPSIGTVFSKLKNSNFEDIHLPAKGQFKGQGSCGNGAAMRTSPGGLFGYHDDEQLVKVCSESARLTHYHISGVKGALLIAMSVKLALQTNGTIDPVNFVDSLLGKIAPFEEEFLTSSQPNQPGDDDSQMSTSQTPPIQQAASEIKVQMVNGQPSYTSRLQQIRALLTQENVPSADEVQALLGHGVLAGEAVPCAIFAFLKCSQDSFQELIPYSISLGGDTDTIASMAGAIGGAFWGVEKIPPEWRDCCEESSRAVTLADSLYDLVHQDVESQE